MAERDGGSIVSDRYAEVCESLHCPHATLAGDEKQFSCWHNSDDDWMKYPVLGNVVGELVHLVGGKDASLARRRY